jgi:hypothetical protein
MTLIEDVARLKDMDAPTFSPEMNNKIRKFLGVLGAFQEGDAERLRFVMSGEYRYNNCDCKHCQEATDTLRRLAAVAAKMEAKQE